MDSTSVPALKTPVGTLKRGLIVTAALVAWLSAVGWAGTQLLTHTSTPGLAAPAGGHLPAIAGFTPTVVRPTLVVFAHPKCPCTRATMAELERLIARTQVGFDTLVLVYRPSHEQGGWEDTAIARGAKVLPNATVVTDVDGNWARSLGVSTSGQVLMFSPAGEAIFSGGITPSRGHEGDSAGSLAIRRYIATGERPAASTAVFGCSIAPSDVAAAEQAGNSQETRAPVKALVEPERTGLTP